MFRDLLELVKPIAQAAAKALWHAYIVYLVAAAIIAYGVAQTLNQVQADAASKAGVSTAPISSGRP